jgi:hypothetical protein
MNAQEIKSKIEKLEKTVNNPLVPDSLKEGIKSQIEKLKSELEKAESEVEKKVEKAEEKVEKAETKTEEKRAKQELKRAEEQVKVIEKINDKIETVEEKVEAIKKGRGRPKKEKQPKEKKPRGGKREGSGRKPAKSSSPLKMVKPKGAVSKVASRKVAKKEGKSVTARAFGKTVEYKNDKQFCNDLIKAFKTRRKTYKAAKKKTKPVFGIITSKVKDSVIKAIDNTPKKQIEANPKAFLSKAQRLEKSAIRFLEDFKAMLGSDFKKSEISKEFGDVEKAIKKLVSKYS